MDDEGFGRKDLRNAEREAVGLKPIEAEAEDNISGARAGEEQARGFYSGSGKKITNAAGGGFLRRGGSSGWGGASNGRGGKRNLKGVLKKRGPMAAIGGILIAVVGLMNGAQSLMPVAIEEMIIEKFNSIGVSSTMSSDNFLNTQLNQGVLTHSEKRGELVNGQQMNLFAFSEYQVQQFAGQGIKVLDNVDNYNGVGVTVLLYKSGKGYKAVVGSSYLGKISDAAIISAAGISAGEFLGQVSVKDAFSDSAFKTPYTTASKAWRGGSSGWFDQIMSNITEAKLSIERNRWSRYVTKSIKSITDDFKKIAKSVNLEKTSDGGVNADEFWDETQTTKNEQGEDVKTTVRRTEEISGEVKVIDDDNGSVVGSATVSEGALSKTSTLDQINNVLNSKAVKAASAAADYSCALLEGMISIYTVVSAYQNLQFLNLISGYLEAVDKMKAGDGDGSPIHEYGLNLTAAGATKDNDGNVVEGKENTTAMESAGMSWLFGKNNSISKNDPSVQNVNFESIMSNLSTITGNVSLAASVYEYCGYVKAAVAGVDLAATIISFIPIFGQGFKAIQLTAKEAAKVAIKAAVQVALYAIIPIAARKVASMLIEDAATEWFGEDLGNALVSGANKYLGGNGTSGGQSPGSTKKVLSYMNVQNAVIAEEAEYQRSVRSPFDITSHYTFLGSLAYSIIPFAYSSGGMASMLRNMSSAVSNSVVAMLPTANAIDEQSALTSSGDCDMLRNMDIQGDAFCNAYVITDTSTMGIAAEDIVQIVHEGGNREVASLYDTVKSKGNNFNDDGSIKKGSDLAKYITYCGQRTSQYGIKDAAIAEQVTGANSTASKIIGYVPLLNNVQTIAQGIKEEVYMKWANGRACVASDQNDDWEPEYKYYQRYAENERLLESIDPKYKSKVTAYLEDYYDENPLDQSFEGVIARFSGMTKEDVSDTLALMEYYEFLEEYKPEERYAFVKTEEAKPILFDNENKLAENVYIILMNAISFADLRSRNFAV